MIPQMTMIPAMIPLARPMARSLARPAAACRRLIVAAAIATVTVVAASVSAPAQTVVALVNGEPITALDVESRMKFNQLTTQKPGVRGDVINDLIDEKLKVREGKRWGMEFTDAEVEALYANMASRMRQSADQLTQTLQKGGVNPQTLKSKIRADSVWQQLVRGRFQPSLQLNEKDVELALQAKNQSGQSTTATEYIMRPILILVPPGSQPATFDAKRKEAEALRTRFKSCEEGLPAARAMGAVVRDQVIRNSGDLNPELQKILDSVPIGQLTAPEVTRHGVEMWAICGKQESKADAPIKKQTRDALAAERFEQQSKTYLQRLRREALIERKESGK
jgi:peptidyl-prolyl cis-trans isomerase SurA